MRPNYKDKYKNALKLLELYKFEIEFWEALADKYRYCYIFSLILILIIGICLAIFI